MSCVPDWIAFCHRLSPPRKVLSCQVDSSQITSWEHMKWSMGWGLTQAAKRTTLLLTRVEWDFLESLFLKMGFNRLAGLWDVYNQSLTLCYWMDIHTDTSHQNEVYDRETFFPLSSSFCVQKLSYMPWTELKLEVKSTEWNYPEGAHQCNISCSSMIDYSYVEKISPKCLIFTLFKTIWRLLGSGHHH